ncbi:hypothetical protein HMY34_16580 [Thiothrix subterranea]|uniref:hypothetical protein n=1 Tax=Thiothrix subterranea TaxID=2735563 RepID=UPI00192B6835|nr:hypothetical protein [Thiothrix subterranea]QQZ30243.1 hypothetical protein HMY34_16580 [Thiothrix subterranea]
MLMTKFLLMEVRALTPESRLYVYEVVLKKVNPTGGLNQPAAFLEGAEPRRTNSGVLYNFMRELQDKQAANRLLKYWHKQRSQQWFQSRGLHLPNEDSNSAGSVNKVINDTDVVKLL